MSLSPAPGAPQYVLVNDLGERDERIVFVNDESKESTTIDPRIAMTHWGAKKSDRAPGYSRDFRRKLSNFRARLRQEEGYLRFEVRRGYVFLDTWTAFGAFSPNDLKKQIHMSFADEDGLDYGGLAREWLFLLSRDMLNPLQVSHVDSPRLREYSSLFIGDLTQELFEYNCADDYTLQVNPRSDQDTDDQYKFVGRIIGMAIFHGRLLEAYFVRQFYKMILGRKVSFLSFSP